MKPFSKSILLAFATLFIVSGCSSVDKCTGEFAAGSDWELMNEFPVPENAIYCSYENYSAEERPPTGLRRADFYYYDVKEVDEFRGIIADWDAYLTKSGYGHDDNLMPANSVSDLNGGGHTEDEIADLKAKKEIFNVYHYFSKDDELLSLWFDWDYFNFDRVKVRIEVAPPSQLAPAHYVQIIDSAEIFYQKYRKIQKGRGKVEKTGWKNTKTGNRVFYIHTGGERFDQLFEEILLPIRSGEYSPLSNAQPIRNIEWFIMDSDYIVVYNRTGMNQPVYQGSAGVTAGGGRSTDYYREGTKRGKFYVLESRTLDVLAVKNISRSSVYDFPEAPFEENSGMMEKIKGEMQELLKDDQMFFGGYEEQYF